MEKNNTAIIADTSALISLATDTDHNNMVATQAAETLSKASRPIILPADVFVETVNVLGKRSGHDTAIKAASALLREDSQFILVETSPYIKAALANFQNQ